MNMVCLLMLLFVLLARYYLLLCTYVDMNIIYLASSSAVKKLSFVLLHPRHMNLFISFPRNIDARAVMKKCADSVLNNLIYNILILCSVPWNVQV